MKILDFGLAKLSPLAGPRPLGGEGGEPPADGEPSEGESTQVGPTASVSDLHLTKTGVAMGTAPYMSPEQVRGEKLDARTDVFSFGLVLYEMAAGQQAFGGDTVVEIHSAILNRTPTSTLELNPQVPPDLGRVVSRALEKDRDTRYQRVSDLRVDLERVRHEVRTPSGRVRWRWPPKPVAMVAIFVVGAAIAWFVSHRTRTLPELKQWQLTTSSNENAVESGAISPDGKYLAYSDVKGMHIKLVETGETHTVPQPETLKGGRVNWQIAAWYPDSTRFLTNASQPGPPGRKLNHPSVWWVSVMGGAPRKLHDDAYAWSISRDGTSIAFTTNFRLEPEGYDRVDREVWLMDLNGAQARKLFGTDENSDLANVHWAPQGRRVAYTRRDLARDKLGVFIESRDLQGGPPTTILSEAGLQGFVWLPDGRMIYSLSNPPPSVSSCNLWEIRADPWTGEPEDKPRRLTSWAGSCVDSLSARADGKQLAFRRWSHQGGTYVADFEAGETRITNPRRLTLNEGEFASAWTADSRAVVFYGALTGRTGIFKQALDEDTAQPIVTGLEEPMVPRVTPDGVWILHLLRPRRQDPSKPFLIMRVPTAGGTPQLVLTASLIDSPRCAKSPGSLCAIGERSPGGKQIIITALDPVKGRGRELIRFDVDDPNGMYGFDVSPDGSRIAVCKKNQRIVILSLSGQAQQEFTVKNWKTGMDWAADGKGLFVSTSTPRGSALTHVDLQGNARVVWEREGSTGTYGVPSPDGRHLLMWSATINSNLWMLENF